jgi:hypothetical protein
MLRLGLLCESKEVRASRQAPCALIKEFLDLAGMEELGWFWMVSFLLQYTSVQDFPPSTYCSVRCRFFYNGQCIQSVRLVGKEKCSGVTSDVGPDARRDFQTLIKTNFITRLKTAGPIF